MANRSLLVPFQPLEIDWFGCGERHPKTAEPSASATLLGGSTAAFTSTSCCSFRRATTA